MDSVFLSYNKSLLYYGGVSTDNDHYFISVEDEKTDVELYESLTKVNTEVGSRPVVEFPAEVGYLVLLIPAGIKPFNRWYVRSNNKGYIDGSADYPYYNLFPSPYIAKYQDAYYWVYISNYKTQVTTPMTLMRE